MNAKYLKTKPGKIYRAPLLFLLLASTFLCSLPDQLHGWNSAWYAMDYSLGVDSRLFVGSFLRLFYPDFLPASSAYAFNVLSTLVLLALLSHVLASVLRLVENTPCETGLLALTTLWLLSPGSPAYLWNTENMGRFDLYLFLVTLIAAAVFLHVRAVSVRFAVFTICGMVCLAIHQGYLFTFFPLLAAMYLLTAENRKQLIAAFSCMAVLGVVFLYFQFFSHIRPGSYEELASVLAARTDLPLNESALRFEYFSGFADSARELVTNQLGERIRYGIVTLLLLSPWHSFTDGFGKKSCVSRLLWKIWMRQAEKHAFLGEKHYLSAIFPSCPACFCFSRHLCSPLTGDAGSALSLRSSSCRLYFWRQKKMPRHVRYWHP